MVEVWHFDFKAFHVSELNKYYTVECWEFNLKVTINHYKFFIISFPKIRKRNQMGKKKKKKKKKKKISSLLKTIPLPEKRNYKNYKYNAE